MKTKQKKEYVSPQIDVILVELEEGIAQTSGNFDPQVEGHGSGTGYSGWSTENEGETGF